MIEHPADVGELGRSLYGEPPAPMDGTLHVVAVDASRRVMKIGPRTPKSATDFAVLQLARARVEAILVSGTVLRAEPDLRYEIAPAFREWRAAAGLVEPPWLVVLTRGAIELSHPALSGWARPLIFTGEAARFADDRGIEIVRVPSPSARAAIEYVRARGKRSISIEAGPRTAVPLYDPPCAVDELLLSVFEGVTPEGLDAGAFLSEDELSVRGFELRSAARVDEPSGTWRFERWISRARRGTAASCGSPSRGSA